MSKQENYKNIGEFCQAKTDEYYLYIENGNEKKSVADVIDEIKNHFGQDAVLSDFIISTSYEQFRCYGYDLHDWDDYGTVMIVHKKTQT